MQDTRMRGWAACLVEAALLLLLLGLLPAAVLAVEIVFSYGTARLPAPCLAALYTGPAGCGHTANITTPG